MAGSSFNFKFNHEFDSIDLEGNMEKAGTCSPGMGASFDYLDAGAIFKI